MVEQEQEDQSIEYLIPSSIPLFDRYEIQFGAILGSGSFCTVCAISNIIASTNTVDDDLDWDCDDSDNHQNQNLVKETKLQWNKRQHLIQQFEDHNFSNQSANSIRSPDKKPPPRYAIKYLKRGLSTKDRERGKQDLEMELHLLLKCQNIPTTDNPVKSNLTHPNIISLLGVGGMNIVQLNSSPEIKSMSLQSRKERFLILDRLKSTLQNRFAKWRNKRGIGLMEVLAINDKANKDLWLERLIILSNISSAVLFLHEHNIIYRDLKPENIGFDYDETPKLFDFGLARTLPTQQKDDGRQTYKMTGMTGSPRYMAPEVSMNKPYGTNADVYSFGIMINEVLSLKVPFAGTIGIRQLQHDIIKEGIRPFIDPLWPISLSELITDMWDGDYKKRPTSKQVVKRLEALLRGTDDDLFPSWGVSRWFR